MKYDVARPYTASYVIIRREGKIAFVLREHTSWMNDYYGLPSGKVDKGESYLTAAAREAKEEVGIKIDEQALRHVLTMHRNVASEDMVWVDIYFEAAEWEGEPYNAEPHIHGELAWLDPANLPKNVVPSVRAAIKAITAGKPYIEYGWKK